MIIIVIKIIILLAWAFCAISVFANYEQIINDFTDGLDTWFVYIVLILAAPIFTLNNLFLALLGLFLPEGWEDGDEEFYKKLSDEILNKIYNLIADEMEKDNQDKDDKDEQ